jgi:hypothetical protein
LENLETSVFSELQIEISNKMDFFNLEENCFSEDCYEEFSNLMTIEVHKYFSYQILFRYIRKQLNLAPSRVINVSKCIVLADFYTKMREHDLRIIKILHPDFADKTCEKELGWLELDFYPSCLTSKIDNFLEVSNKFPNTIFLKQDFLE